MTDHDALLDVRGLSVGLASGAGGQAHILHGVDLRVRRGESVGIVGESGSGKSTLALAMMGYLKRGLTLTGGQACFAGADMFARTRPELERIRGGRLALIPQNSGQSLTPSLRIGTQIAEALRLHANVAAAERPGRVAALLARVRLPDPARIGARYPHELSGGQQQRAAIAMALAGEPEALLLDEPTTGLDVTTQAYVLDLLRDLARERGMAMIYVSHDLGAIAQVCARVVVMYAGEIVLDGAAHRVLRAPAHPYPKGLLASIPRLHDAALPLALEGRPPPPDAARVGCSFAARCALASDVCRRVAPALTATAHGDLTRCHHADRLDTLPARPAVSAGARTRDAGTALLTIDDLAISYHRPHGIGRLWAARAEPPPTVMGVTLALARGETMGLVGESGSGKSTILKAVAGLLAPSAGQLRWQGGGVLAPRLEHRPADQLRRIQLIFQNPDESLNPRQTVAQIIAQPLQLYFGLAGEALRSKAADWLHRVRLGTHYLDRLPGQLSGGEKQRVAIARAFAAEPDLVLCDEITSALDVSVQAAVLDLLDDLRRTQTTAYIFVSHDLAVVRALADRVAVLYQGRVCEIGPVDRVYAAPSHPYTAALLGAVLEPDPDLRPTLAAGGSVEHAPPPAGCAFQRRCPRKPGAICDTQTPPWRSFARGHAIRCHLPAEAL